MARFRINEIHTLAIKGKHTATSWQVYLDSNYTQLIAESLRDPVNLTEWNNPLPVIGSQTEYYKDLDNIYVRVKVFSINGESDWFSLQSKNQNDQSIIITEDGKQPITRNSIAMGLN